MVSSFDFSIVSPAFAGHAPISVLPLKCYFFSPVTVLFFVFAAFCAFWLLSDIYVSLSDQSHLVERHVAQQKHKKESDRKKFAAVLSSIGKLRKIEEEDTANKVVQMHHDSMSKLEESLEGKKQTAKNRLHTRIANRSKRSVTGKSNVINTGLFDLFKQ